MKRAVPTAVLPVGLAIVILGTLTGGGVAAADLRADERRAAQARVAAAVAEAERRAVAAYLDAAAPLVEKVFDHVQPVQGALRRYDEDKPGGLSVLIDVTRRGGARSAVAARGRELKALKAPPVLEPKVAALLGAVPQYDSAFTLVERIENELFASFNIEDDDASFMQFSGKVTAAGGALDVATTAWGGAVIELFRERELPSVPDGTGAKPAGRQPVSKGSFLLTAGDFCSGSAVRIDDLADGADLAELERYTKVNVPKIDKAVTRLLGIKVPAKDEAVIERTVRVPLRRFAVELRSATRVVAALKAGDLAVVERESRIAIASEKTGMKAAAGLEAYGSTTCADALRGE